MNNLNVPSPTLSVVVPVYDEEAGLQALLTRTYPALDALGVSYEIVFVDDGSRDRSAKLLAEQFERRPDVTRVVLLNGNFGQHRAIMAAFEHCRATASSRSTQTCRTRPRTSTCCSPPWTRVTTASAPSALTGRTPRGAAGSRVR